MLCWAQPVRTWRQAYHQRFGAAPAGAAGTWQSPFHINCLIKSCHKLLHALDLPWALGHQRNHHLEEEHMLNHRSRTLCRWKSNSFYQPLTAGSSVVSCTSHYCNSYFRQMIILEIGTEISPITKGEYSSS